MSTSIRFLPSLLALSLIVSCSPKPSEAPATALSLKKVVVALKPDKNPDAMLEEKEKLTAFLSQALKVPVEVIIPLSSSVIQEGLSNGTVDLAYVSGTGMVQARSTGVADILVAGEIEGRTDYPSYWIALKEAPYTSIADLKGKRVAFSSKTSTSGGLVPRADLVKQGLLGKGEDPEAFFGKDNVWYGTGYVSAVERVLNGDAEAAAVSYYVLDLDKHLTLEQRARLKKIDEQGPVPTHAIVVRSSLSATDRATLLAVLLSLNKEPNTALRDKVFTSKLVVVDPAQHVSPLVEYIELTKP
ncbi:MAG: phosphate/phosphite/phosphonate ABC transporter substrate-binding protein [Blastochloris sp.]|jgi:phosphonate transport system substrate-binding protein|nr:phosphate/phosphite/phosphonate ABC transporter substrate-binding protein [Blastochloris sp.]